MGESGKLVGVWQIQKVAVPIAFGGYPMLFPAVVLLETLASPRVLICLQVSPQHEDIQDCTQKSKPARKRRKQPMLSVQNGGKHSTAEGVVCCGETTASACNQHQHRTIGTSILHYGMKRRNVRPLAMAESEKKQNGANGDENCMQCPPTHTRNGSCDEVPTPPPPSPLRDVVNTVGSSRPTPPSVEQRPSTDSSAGLDNRQDKTELIQSLRSATPESHSKGKEPANEQLFSITEITLLQESRLSSQLPRPGAVPVSPLLSSSPLPKPLSEKPSTPCLLFDKQTHTCQDSDDHQVAIETHERCTSQCISEPFSNIVSARTPHLVNQARVEEDCVDAWGCAEGHMAAQLPTCSGDTVKGTSDGCGEPSITESVADIMHCLDFDLSMSFQAMQISKGGQLLST